MQLIHAARRFSRAPTSSIHCRSNFRSDIAGAWHMVEFRRIHVTRPTPFPESILIGGQFTVAGDFNLNRVGMRP